MTKRAYGSAGILTSLVTLMTVTALATPAAQAQQLLRIVIQEEPASLDPCDTGFNANSRVVRNNVTETLVNISVADGAITSNLAESWEQTAPNRWRFHLKSGVTFHDGTPFNASAVEAALTRAQSEPLGCSVRGSKLGDNPYTVEIIDDLTIDIIGERDDPIVPYRMAVLDIGSPAATPADAKTDLPVGTGPYVLTSWNKGNDIRLTANAEYRDGVPANAEVLINWRSESAVRAAMVDTGEADLAFGIAPQDATSELDKTYVNSEVSFIRLDTQVPPLDDIRVRRAIIHAIDRNAMIGTVFHKDVRLATQIILPSVVGYSADIAPLAYDPELAAQLLDAARQDGVPVDTEIVIYGRIGLYPNSTEAMEVVQAMLMAAGLNVRVEMMETAVWLKKLVKPFAEDRVPSMIQSQHDNTQGDAVFTIGPRFGSEGTSSTLTDTTLDALIALATKSTGTLRRNAFELAFQYMDESIVPIVPMFDMVDSVRVAANVSFEPDVQTSNEIKLKSVVIN